MSSKIRETANSGVKVNAHEFRSQQALIQNKKVKE